MELQYFGANCIKIVMKNATVTVDDNLAELGGKAVLKPQDIALFTLQKPEKLPEAKIVIGEPGEYEVSDVSITGIAARSHMDEAGKKSANMFKIITDDIRLAVIGHVYPELSDEQLEALGTIDVMFIPVGGNGFTLDGLGALALIKEIEPKIIVPTYYANNKLRYPVPAQELSEALKALAMEPAETVPKLKLKGSELTDIAKLVVIEPQ